MTSHIAAAAALLALAACTDAQNAKVTQALSTPPGALVCAIQTSGGGQIMATLVKTAATGAMGTGAAGAAGGALMVIATGATKAFVDQACAAAAKSTGGTAGVPVSPPADVTTLPQVAVVLPTA